MKKIFISMIAFAMMLPIGCEKIKDVTSRDFTVNNINFDFTATAQDDVTTSSSDLSVTTRAVETTSFAVTRTVDNSEFNNADIIKYAGKINKVVVNSSVISVTSVPASDFTITNLKVIAEGILGSIEVPTYVIGGTYIVPAAMNAYTSAFIMKLLDGESIRVTVTGQSNAPAGTVLNINYKNDILCTASLL